MLTLNVPPFIQAPDDKNQRVQCTIRKKYGLIGTSNTEKKKASGCTIREK
jgi:hypothetical protein